jgi:hypothetical protein
MLYPGERNAMNHRLSQVAVLFSFASLMATFGYAETLQFGSRSLDIPNPEGFEPLAAVSPRYMQAAQAYLPATNRLVEAYAVPTDAKALAQGQPATLARYFQMQVPRKAEGVAVSAAEFADASKEVEGSFEQTLKNSQPLATQLTDQGNAEVKRLTASDPKIALSGIGYLGTFRREPWGLFFTIKSGLTAEDGTNQVIVCGGALVLVNYQLLFLYSYSRYHDESDRRWVEQATSAWADAARAANPDDPKVAATASHGKGKNVRMVELLGAIFFALFAIGFLLRQRKR